MVSALHPLLAAPSTCDLNHPPWFPRSQPRASPAAVFDCRPAPKLPFCHFELGAALKACARHHRRFAHSTISIRIGYSDSTAFLLSEKTGVITPFTSTNETRPSA